MTAAILLCVSIVTLGQFCFYYWRATFVSVSAQPVSERIRVAAKMAAPAAGSQDFRAILATKPSLNDVTDGIYDRVQGGAFIV